jgi:hypothetical protein
MQEGLGEGLSGVGGFEELHELIVQSLVQEGPHHVPRGFFCVELLQGENFFFLELVQYLIGAGALYRVILKLVLGLVVVELNFFALLGEVEEITDATCEGAVIGGEDAETAEVEPAERGFWGGSWSFYMIYILLLGFRS